MQQNGGNSNPSASDGGRPFRFFDNRAKYLQFVTTCGEKWSVAERLGVELADLAPIPPALQIFDAGMGDGTVLASTLRQAHEHFPTIPFCVVGKEISMEDVRLSLEKMPDRFAEHPQMVLAITNMHYSEAPHLLPHGDTKQAALNWSEIQLEGNTAHEFDSQIDALQPRINDWWQVKSSEKTGNPLYVEPSVLVIYRADQRFLLDAVIPQRGPEHRSYDLIIAAQPYRSRTAAATKVKHVLGPLTRALAPGGRMIAIQSTGQDPGMEIIRQVWPGEAPFATPGPMLLKELSGYLGADLRHYQFMAESDKHALFRYALHTLPEEVREPISASTLLAAWNAAIYVAQIDDVRTSEAMSDHRYLEATADVLTRHGGLWFTDESFVVTKNPR